jgi:hypothetical protein
MPRHIIAVLNETECNAFLNSRRVDENGDVYYTDPYNQRPIQETTQLCTLIHDHCQNMTTNRDVYMHNLIQRWFSNPLVDPITSTAIRWSLKLGSPYVELYYLAFEHLCQLYDITADNQNIFIIEEALPQNHLLFNGKINLLFYNCLINEVDEIDVINDHNYLVLQNYYEFIDETVSTMSTPESPSTVYKDVILNRLSEVFIESLAHFITYVISIRYIDFDSINNDQYISKIKKYQEDVIFVQGFNFHLNTYNDFIRTSQIMNMSIMVKQYLHKDVFYMDDNQLYIDMIINNLIQANNFIDTLSNYYQEILKIYEYTANLHESPFLNTNLQPYDEIEDPLIKILSDIGIDNLDLVNLKIPTRPFHNDAEYNKYLEEYNQLKKKYEHDLNKFQNGKTLERPERPSMALTSGKMINVITGRLPYYMKDRQYNEIVRKVRENEHIITMYKNLIDKGLLDLMNNITVTDVDETFLKKDRQYFKDHVFFNNDGDKSKCNDNVDVGNITEEFDSDDYLLAKLQLMYQLKSYDQNGDISRVDCFYAPNLYNMIVVKMNNREVITNPVSGALIRVDEVHAIVDELVQILRVVIPDIVTLRYRLPVHDQKLELKKSIVRRGNESFYEIYVVREIIGINIKICDICCIPSDIQDTNISSDKFFEKIEYLFTHGFLMNSYVPPYCIQVNNNNRTDRYYFKTGIHFNNYTYVDQWPNTKEKKKELYIHYFEEISKYA